VFKVTKVQRKQSKKPVPKWAFSEEVENLDVFNKKDKKAKLPKLSDLDIIDKQS
jgi:hypothetical protein